VIDRKRVGEASGDRQMRLHCVRADRVAHNRDISAQR
jgi:hypothetical protein